MVIAHRIDVHQHILPDFYLDAMGDLVARENAALGVPRWSPEWMLAHLEAWGIAAAVVSVSSPGVHRGDDRDARDLARRCNEYLAQLSAWDRRIGAFAVLPLPDVDGALRELAYALDTLRFDGVALLTSYAGSNLGAPAFDDVFSELDRRHGVVLVHPTTPPSSAHVQLDIPGPVLEFVFDTTRAVANLIYSGTLERYPNVRIIVSHAGGAAPFLAWRIGAGWMLPGVRQRAPQGAMAYLRHLYYDTALSAAAPALRALQQVADPSHILFGSDFPFAPEPVTRMMIDGLASYDGLDEAGRLRVERENALVLFPRLQAAVSSET
jgi:predicted TIM-barrel fold metal-dependent hydrolase